MAPDAAPITTRFAPSPTGELHRGHALAAVVAHDVARNSGGRFLLRIEDIDGERCRPEHVAGIRADLAWLGLEPDAPPFFQSTRLPVYRAALERLQSAGLVYPCYCTRREIAAEIALLAMAPQGSDGPPYPGTCRLLTAAGRRARQAAGGSFALRLDVAAALASLGGETLRFMEYGRGPAGENGLQAANPANLGDVVLGRRDVGVSYHLACVLDDAEQGVTRVTRGEDLFTATHTQRLLQALLGLPVPDYQHHPLVRDANGQRLAKRHGSASLATLRSTGVEPAQLLRELREAECRDARAVDRSGTAGS